MVRHAWLVFSLIALSVMGLSLAYASPPDPSWIRGVYDGDDYDDVVILVTGGTGAVDLFPLRGPGPEWTLRDRTADVDELAVPTAIPSPNLTRGPPAL